MSIERELEVLAALSDSEGLNITEISRLLNCKRDTARRLVDAMIDTGMVYEVRDGRETMIYMSDGAAELLDGVLRLYERCSR